MYRVSDETKVVMVNGQAKKVKTMVEEVSGDVTYVGNKVVAVDARKVNTGYVKGRKKTATPKDRLRGELQDLMLVYANRWADSKAIKAKVGFSKEAGTILRMEDADYGIRVAGHNDTLYVEDEQINVNYETRGKSFAGSIARLLVAEIRNPKSEIGKLKIKFVEIKASGIRVHIDGLEFTLKISKKRARAVMN